MTRLMFDSTAAVDIPITAKMVAGYIDHPRYTWSLSDWARFPNAIKVRIAINPATRDGHVIDCETSDATPNGAVAWVKMRRAMGSDPTVYCNQLYGWPLVHQAFRNAGEREPHYWVARYDNVAVIPAGAIAKQYANATFTGHHYDLSVVADYWPGIDGGHMDNYTQADRNRDNQLATDLVGENMAGTGKPNLAPSLYQLVKDLAAKSAQPIDIPALAKAVADELARRMQS